MTTFDFEDLEFLGKLVDKASYLKKVYVVVKEWTIDEFCSQVNPFFSNIDRSKNTKILGKVSKKGHPFQKAEFTMKNGSKMEFDLAFVHDYEAGDQLDSNTLVFKVEAFDDDARLFVEGDLAKERDPE